jgi:uncharacterized protein (TIGR02145 family)
MRSLAKRSRGVAQQSAVRGCGVIHAFGDETLSGPALLTMFRYAARPPRKWSCWHMSSTAGAHITDSRDGQSYRTVRLNDGRIWFAENLRFRGSVVEERARIVESKTNGLLYDWSTASLACPPNWRLPTSAEWWTLIDAHGGEERAPESLMSYGFDLSPTAAAWSGDANFWTDQACFWTATSHDGRAMMQRLLGRSNTDPSAVGYFLMHADGTASKRFLMATESVHFHLAVRCIRIG